ncbi:MAG: CocE/NonD family hydrolase [Actinomycetota bacterium]
MGTEEHIFIEMSDGVRLAGNLYLPDEPAPVVIEALPYRKDDLTANYAPEYRRLRDEGGYAVARIDLRGCGSSEGLATDEYPVSEQRDLCEVISWLARRDFCTGSVGMYGTSYSGFNSIQVAMERPPELKAIVAIYATDDRYTDDVHYEGGALRALDQIDYCLYMTPMNALPPPPSIAGPSWLDMWSERVERLEPWLLRWIDEQNDGPYWRHGSLRPRYDAIEAATMIVGGWADGYRNATFRAFEQLRCDKRLLIGPWSHASAESALPGPHIDLVPEMIRWWDRWLRDEPNGIDEEPPITIFVRHSTKPEPDLAEIRGEWRHENVWPPERLSLRELALDSALRPAGTAESLEVRGDVGWTAHLSCAGVMPWGQPQDQRPDEAYSLVYDWGPFDDEVEILGYPRARLAVAATKPVAFVSAKLCDVFEDGTSALISRGFLNLTHRESHASPQSLEPGVLYEVSVDLTATSWVLPRGHVLRLSLAGTDWPNVWPPPQPVTLTFDPGRSRLDLPVLEGSDELPAPRLRPPPAERRATGSAGPQNQHGTGSAGPQNQHVSWHIEHDILERETRYVVDHGSTYDTEMGSRVTESYFGRVSVSTTDPGDSRAEGRVRFEIVWPEATAVAEVRATLGSSAREYRLEMDLDVTHDGASLGSRRWERRFPRRLQ